MSSNSTVSAVRFRVVPYVRRHRMLAALAALVPLAEGVPRLRDVQGDREGQMSVWDNHAAGCAVLADPHLPCTCTVHPGMPRLRPPGSVAPAARLPADPAHTPPPPQAGQPATAPLAGTPGSPKNGPGRAETPAQVPTHQAGPENAPQAGLGSLPAGLTAPLGRVWDGMRPAERRLLREAVEGLVLAYLPAGPQGQPRAVREGMRRTPERVLAALEEMTAGYLRSPAQVLGTTFESDGYNEVVALGGIPFYSLCEHHLLPFHGTVGVAYLPSSEGRVVGLSKLARVVDVFARRFQIQERMTREIADAIAEALRPEGVAVIVRAHHTCMSARGVNKPGTNMTTSVMTGTFRTHPEARAEVMRLLR